MKLEMKTVMDEGTDERVKEITVTNILGLLGIKANIKGYWYLRDAIVMCANESELLEAVTKQLYPRIAKKYNSSPTRVERAIRHAIGSASNCDGGAAMKMFFGGPYHNGRNKPTNSEFIATAADRLRLNMLPW